MTVRRLDLRRFVCGAVLACGSCRPVEHADDAPSSARVEVDADGAREPVPPQPSTPAASFEGRPIAATMSHHGADWLTRPEREVEEDPDALHRALALRPGQAACDVGAGNGYHSLRMAAAVAPGGRVIASDLQPEMLALLRARADAASVRNLETVIASQTDAGLPAGGCDLVLLVDVYHELADPSAMLAALRASLSPQGRLVLVEFRGEDDAVPIKPEHKMTRAQVLRELEPRGFTLVQDVAGLPWQHVLVFHAR